MDRNRRIARMHRDGRSNRAIARDIGLSPPQVGRIVKATRVRPEGFHNPITSCGVQVGSGVELRVDDENRNGCAAESCDETQQQQPEEQREQVNQGPQAYETTQYEATRVTPVVDNWAGGVDNSPSFWEEALREGARRWAEESRRWAERERRTWWDRGPPEE